MPSLQATEDEVLTIRAESAKILRFVEGWDAVAKSYPPRPMRQTVLNYYDLALIRKRCDEIARLPGAGVCELETCREVTKMFARWQSFRDLGDDEFLAELERLMVILRRAHDGAAGL